MDKMLSQKDDCVKENNQSLGDSTRVVRWRSQFHAVKSILKPKGSRTHLKNPIILFRWILLVMAVVVIIMVAVYVNLLENAAWYREEFRIDYTQSELTSNKGYLVYSDNCKIPSIDPYVSEVMYEFRRNRNEPCTRNLPITSIQYNHTTRHYTLSYNYTTLNAYKINPHVLDCCYKVITRKLSSTLPDFYTIMSPCTNFTEVSLDRKIDYIMVTCRIHEEEFYKTGYALIQERPDVRERLDNWKLLDRSRNQNGDYVKEANTDSNTNSNSPSILMIGIDSVSRVNLMRSMPRTAKYLYENNWFEMAGYNKVDDNTFPNLMAVLSGLNKTLAFKRCRPQEIGGLDKCDLIWYRFRKYGYVTAYAEDEVVINTFNYYRKGFQVPPTDYYLRPFLITAEKQLHITKKSDLVFCLGEQHSADYVFKYASDFIERYQNDSYFGLFWSNTFSHNYFSDCSSMDQSMVGYLKQFSKIDANRPQSRIVIFFSDHGMRFGKIRNTISGYYEDRLPFMFMWLSPDLRQRYPQFVNALVVNRHRLSCPYDIHNTLQHLLSLGGRVNNTNDRKPAESCKHCQTLLEIVPENRSCADISIAAHWCTCNQYKNIYRNSKISRIATRKIIEEINALLKHANMTIGTKKSCAHISLDTINFTYYIDSSDYDADCRKCNIYRSVFSIKPSYAVFEGTIIHNLETDQFKISGEISRTIEYTADRSCINDVFLEKYCICE